MVRAAGFEAAFDSATATFHTHRGKVAPLHFVDANPNARIVGAGNSSTVYYHLRDSSEARHAYERVECRDLYPGVHLAWHGTHHALEYDFTVDPGADPSRIQIRFDQATSQPRRAMGLAIALDSGERLIHRQPVAYQEIDGVTREVDVSFREVRRGVVGFEVGIYDHSRPLIIDPVVSYAGYLGGTGSDLAYGVTVDSHGSAYVVGETGSPAFPGWQPSIDTRNVATFVTRFDTSARQVVFTVILAGDGRVGGRGIALDAAGSVYVAGMTNATNFPTTVGALRRTAIGQGDAFFCKLSANGATLLYSTLLGGAGEDVATGLAVTPLGEAVVTGYTSSQDFPVTSGAVQTRYGGGSYDAFLARFSATGTLSYATYLGGSDADLGFAVALDAAGSAYLTGSTASSDFPTLAGVQTSQKGQGDGFVTKINSSGSAIQFSTYLGGSGADYGSAIALDTAGSIYVAGTTLSGDLPATGGALQRVPHGSYDAFVAKYSGTGLAYMTYLGGTQSDAATALAVDGVGNAYVGGYTFSGDFPLAGAQLITAGSGQEAFLSVINPGGTALLASLLLRGSAQTVIAGIALDSASAVYAAGYTSADDFLAADGVGQRASTRHDPDTFLVKLSGVLSSSTGSPSIVSVTPSSGSTSSQTFAIQLSDTDGYAAIASAEILLTGTDGRRCHLNYVRAAGTISLATDSDSGWLGPAALLGSGLLQNSYCWVSAANSAATASGNGVLLNLSLGFTAAFAGARTLSLDVYGTNSLHTGWWPMAAWTVPGAPSMPSIASVTPSSGSGSSQTFTIQMSDADGSAAIVAGEFLFNGADALRCHIFFVPSTGSLYLASLDESVWLGPIAARSSSSLQHTFCTLNAAGSSYTSAGTSVTLNLSVSFTPAYSGSRTLWADVYAANSFHPGSRQVATWTVPGNTAVPSIASVTPNSGTGGSQTFTYQLSDTDGYAAIASSEIVFTGNDALRCHVLFVRSTGALYLASQDESVWLGPVVAGSPGTVQHSYCSINGAASSSQGAGTTVTLNLALTFTNAFSGSRIEIADVYSLNNLHPGNRLVATWTVPGTAAVPSIASVSPLSGTGSSQTFTYQLSDTDGYAVIASSEIVFTGNDALRCHVLFVRSTGALYLASQDESVWLGPVVAGSPGTVQHSYCSINGAASSSQGAGTTVTLNLALTFTNAFSGSRIEIADVYSLNNLHPGNRQVATWTVPGTAAVPSIPSVTPSSGRGSSQTFTFQLSDTDGYAAIASAEIVFTGNDGLRCHVLFVRSTGALYLAAQDESVWLGPVVAGSSGTVQHSYCSINGAASSTHGAGSLVTLNLALNFTSAFTGSRIVIADLYSVNSLHPGNAQVGTWSVP